MHISDSMTHDITDYDIDIIAPVKCFLNSISNLSADNLQISDLSDYQSKNWLSTNLSKHDISIQTHNTKDPKYENTYKS